MDFDPEEIFRRPVDGGTVKLLPGGSMPERRAIEGKLVSIEPLDPVTQSAELYAASHDSAEARYIWDFLPWGPWLEPESFNTWFSEQAQSSDFIWFAFRTKHDGRFKGMACYLDVQPSQGVIEIGGIWFAPEMQRTRAATETLFLMMSYAMDELGYRRLQWRCNALNEKSRNAARRLGFRYEGIFYSHMIVKGHNRDTAWYSILESDWPEIRGNFSDWLADSNFEPDGTARRSLSAMMAERN